MKSLLILCISLLLASGCSEKTTPGVCHVFTPGVEFSAKVHETWCLGDESIKLTPTVIIEDSRCNIPDVYCVWAGRTVLELEIEKAGSSPYRDTLATDESWKGTLDLGGYTLSLLEVRPVERTDFVTDTAAYAFAFVVE